ncbi:MAG: MCP four helix bundle domain-containing protein [Bacteroidota bacterium]
MKWVFQIKHKLRAGLLLLVIIITVLLCNISIRQSFSTLDQTMTSLYNDRLMPATYIFKMADQVYARQLKSLQTGVAGITTQKQNDSLVHLMDVYAKTWLTEHEKALFYTLQKLVVQMGKLETESLKSTPVQSAPELQKELNDTYMQSIAVLDQLSEVQIKEGGVLQKDSKKVIAGTQIQSQLEISLLVILGIAAFVLIAAKEKLIPKERSREWLN